MSENLIKCKLNLYIYNICFIIYCEVQLINYYIWYENEYENIIKV